MHNFPNNHDPKTCLCNLRSLNAQVYPHLLVSLPCIHTSKSQKPQFGEALTLSLN